MNLGARSAKSERYFLNWAPRITNRSHHRSSLNSLASKLTHYLLLISLGFYKNRNNINPQKVKNVSSPCFQKLKKITKTHSLIFLPLRSVRVLKTKTQNKKETLLNILLENGHGESAIRQEQRKRAVRFLQ